MNSIHSAKTAVAKSIIGYIIPKRAMEMAIVAILVVSPLYLRPIIGRHSAHTLYSQYEMFGFRSNSLQMFTFSTMKILSDFLH